MTFKLRYFYKLDSIMIIVNPYRHYDPVGAFLDTEIRGPLESIMFYVDEIDAVLDKRKEVGEATGDANSIDVYPDKTKVTYLFPDPEDGDVFEWIETEKLRSYIFLWFNERHKFYRMYMHPLRTIFDPDYRVYTFLASVYHKQVDFKESFLFYINSETAKEVRHTKRMLKRFLAKDVCLVQKRAYIEHCADGVDFKKEGIDPLVWLESQLYLFPKTNEFLATYIWPIVDKITTELMLFKKWLFNER